MRPGGNQRKTYLPEQQLMQPQVVKREHRVLIMLLRLIPSGLCVLLLIGVISEVLTIIAPGAEFQPPRTSSSPADRIAHSFMDAMMRKEWTVMWHMLYPDTQQLWQGEKDFIQFEQAKFGSVRFVRYSTTEIRKASSWRNPDTTLVYPYTETLSVSLQATVPKGILSAPSALALTHGLFGNTVFALAQAHSVWQVLVAGPADLEAPVLVPASPPLRKLMVPIFMYHHISEQHVQDLLDYNLTVTLIDFNQQLSWLQQHDYHSITQTDLFDALYYGKDLPMHPMMLTFDDGYKDIYTDALPILLVHHYVGVFYIITGMIGGNYMTWRQVATLAQDGMQIASHTIHHVNVGNPPRGMSTQTELVLSKQTLEKQLDQPIQFFCYPSGEPFHHDTVAQQKIVLTDLFTDGYVGATLDPFSLYSTIQNAQTPYQLNRIRVSGGESLGAFIGIVDTTLMIDNERLRAS